MTICYACSFEKDSKKIIYERFFVNKIIIDLGFRNIYYSRSHSSKKEENRCRSCSSNVIFEQNRFTIEKFDCERLSAIGNSE